MSGHTLIADLTVVLGVAAATGVLCRWLRQPPLLGYLLAGLIVGPYIPIPLFADPNRIRELSELGVILVMFSVGIELSIGRLLRLLPTSGFTAVIEIATMGWIGHTFARLLGRSNLEAMFLGGAVAISSTMVVVRVLDERTPDADLRGLVFGILVIQDVAAIAMIATLTAVASGTGPSAHAVLDTALELGATLVLFLVGGLLVVPRIVRAVSALGSSEILVVTTAAVAFGMALLAQRFGYSFALGAFLAGTLVAEARRRHQIEHLVRPIKELFAAIFFVSVGMEVDPFEAASHVGVSLALAALVISGQLFTVSAAGILSGNGVRASILAGASLGQIGEFAFIIIALGTQVGAVGRDLQSVVVTVAVLTTFTTPNVLRHANRLAALVDHHLPRPLVALLGLYESWLERLRSRETRGRVRLRRHGRAVLLDALAIGGVILLVSLQEDRLLVLLDRHVELGERTAEALLLALAGTSALPFVLGLLRNAKRIGTVLAAEIVPAAEDGRADLGGAPRRMIVVTVQLSVLLLLGVPLVAITQPFLPAAWGAAVFAVLISAFGVYFWRTATDLGGHVKAAAELLAEILARTARGSASDSELTAEAGEQLPGLARTLPGLDQVVGVTVGPASAAAGRTLRELDVHARTGAAILVLQRPDGDVIVPGLDEPVRAGDRMALAGTSEAISRARKLLAAAPDADPDAS